MASEPDNQSRDPQAEAQTDGGGKRSIENREAAWGAGDQDWLGKRAVQDDLEAGHR
jgi:hypothetical protein